MISEISSHKTHYLKLYFLPPHQLLSITQKDEIEPAKPSISILQWASPLVLVGDVND